VLPLTTSPSELEQAYLADGLVEHLVVALMVFPDFPIIGPLSRQRLQSQYADPRALGAQYGAQFVLTGWMYKRGERVRITMRLVDASSGTALWAQTFDSPLEGGEPFEFEDAVASQVAATVADDFGVVSRVLARQALEKRTDSLQAYDAVLRYYHHFAVLTEEARQGALEALERAVEQDPDSALIHAMLADMYGVEYHLLGADERALRRMEDLVRRALHLDPRSRLAHQMRAMAHYFGGKRAPFVREAERTLALNPNNTSALASCGLFLAAAGEWEWGLALLRKSMRLNPHHPGWYHFGPFLHLYRQERYQDALHEAAHISTPALWWDPLARAAALGQLDRTDEAGNALSKLQGVLPALDLRELLRRNVFSDGNVDALLEGLHKAGWE
jgi:adenylate cyclase